MAKQKNKPSYSIYPLNALNFKKLMIRSGMKSARKNSIPELAGKIFKMMKKSCLDQHLCVTETMWHSEGKNVLFVPDANFLSNHLKANYAMDGDFSLNLPHSSFILAMPDFKVDNVIIPSVIVHFCTAENRIHRYNKASQLMNVKAFDHEENDLSGLDNLSFFYADPYGDKGIYVQVLSMGLISASLQAETADEYAEIIGQIPKDMVSNIAVDTTEKDSKIQYAITKILVGLSIYLSANENARLIEELPNNDEQPH